MKKYMICSTPEMGCADCGHRGKHEYVVACGKCGSSIGCVPHPRHMEKISVISKNKLLYQCPYCKTIKMVGTKAPKCPECDK